MSLRRLLSQNLPVTSHPHRSSLMNTKLYRANIRRGSHFSLPTIACLSVTFATLLALTTSAFAVPIGGGLQLWLDAADSNTLFQDTAGPGVTPANNGDPVGVWRDKSGNNFHAIVNSNSAARRADRDDTGLGGRPTLSFVAGDGYRVPNTLFVSRPYT